MNYVRFEPTPIIALGYISPYFKGKVVYDLGCGDGYFAKGMQAFAKEVVGVESDPHLAQEAEKNGINVLRQNFMDTDLSGVEGIFVFLNLLGMNALSKKLFEEQWHGTLISHFYPLQDNPFMFIPPVEHIDVKSGNDRITLLRYEL